jgi:hypothetical protein
MVLNDKQKHEAIQKDADRQINEDKLRHEAIQKDADRQVDLAKAILAKSAHDGEVDLDGAMDQASMIVTKNMATGDAKARYDMMEEQKSMAMGELSEKLSQAIQASAGASAPKRVLRDANNMIVGLETVFEELN